MAKQTSASALRTWLIPALVLLALVVLAVFALSLRSDTGATSADTGPTQAAPTQVQQPEQPDLREVERRDAADPFADGEVDAPVGLVVFSDYQCPFCAKWSAETLPVMREYAAKGQLRIEWRDLNIFGPDSRRAALGSYAAAQQGAFWEYHDALFADGKHRKGAELSEEALAELASSLDLDAGQFSQDLNSQQAADEIDGNAQLGIDLGATSSPVFLLDGQPIVGAQPTEVFVEALELALEQEAN